MAYTTGTATTLQQLFDELITFTTANGWTLHDTITASDKVIKSSNRIVRITMSTDVAGNPYKSAAHFNKASRCLYMRGYLTWDAATNTGTGEFGLVGPMFWAGEQYSNSNTGYYWRFDDWDGVNPTDVQWHVSPTIGYEKYDGRRRVYSGDANLINGFDLVTGSAVAGVAHPITNMNLQSNSHALVYDAAIDRDVMYVMGSNSSLRDEDWYKYDVMTQTWTKLASPGWAGQPIGGFALWDGGDYIYAMRGNNSTEFKRYQISTNSWTALTASPVSRVANFQSTSNQSSTVQIYVPANASGLAEDVIYTALAVNSSVCYRYDVTSNVWRSTTGTGALTFPASIAIGDSLIWDYQRYLYFYDSSAPLGTHSFYSNDITQGPGPSSTFTGMGTVLSSTARTFNGMLYVQPFACKVRGSDALDTQYWFLGDSTGINVVTRTGAFIDEQYHWAHFGDFESNYSQSNMTVTSPVTAGFRTTYPVDSSAGYLPGDSVIAWDPASGEVERLTIYSVPNSTSIQASGTKNMGTGAIIGVSPFNFVLTGDSQFAILPFSSGGHRANFESDWYLCEPVSGYDSCTRNGPNIRGYYMPFPFKMYHPYSTLSRYEDAGKLKNAYAIARTTYPKLTAEENVSIGANSYKVFPLISTRRHTGNEFSLVIGPI